MANPNPTTPKLKHADGTVVTAQEAYDAFMNTRVLIVKSGTTYESIKRGVEVEVPDYVAEALRHQEEMLDHMPALSLHCFREWGVALVSIHSAMFSGLSGSVGCM